MSLHEGNCPDHLLTVNSQHVKSGVPSKSTLALLQKSYAVLEEHPIDDVTLVLDESDICKWYFLYWGHKDTDYKGGIYLGAIIFPKEYPFSPPEMQMISPTGRFNRRKPVCTTISSFHEESWSPAWTVESIIVGFLSFMNSEDYGLNCLQTIRSSDRKQYAQGSRNWHRSSCKLFRKYFPRECEILDIATKGQLPLTKAVLRYPLRDDEDFELYIARLKVAVRIFDCEYNDVEVVARFLDLLISLAELDGILSKLHWQKERNKVLYTLRQIKPTQSLNSISRSNNGVSHRTNHVNQEIIKEDIHDAEFWCSDEEEEFEFEDEGGVEHNHIE